MELGVDIDTLTSATASASAPSLSMSPDELQGIVSAVLKCLNPFNELSG